MKTKEIHSMKNDDLVKKSNELKMELMKLNAQVAVGTVPKNPKQIKQIRKTIAKIKTEQKSKGAVL
jgi:ribosomal protein L29